MSAPSPARPPGLRRRMLLEGLLGAVRPEFRADMLIFPAEDPVFGGGACRVGDCRRPARGRGLARVIICGGSGRTAPTGIVRRIDRSTVAPAASERGVSGRS
ncbi:MAG TPA: hypothetical protein VNA67_04200 [Pseudonocardiaceae bacterium]|nr:hypothetical protein [Pseudonocardiaceae bacterium]